MMLSIPCRDLERQPILILCVSHYNTNTNRVEFECDFKIKFVLSIRIISIMTILI